MPGIQVQIFQGSCFRNLLHLELFFRKANDEEARKWIARKQVIAWGIINELSAEIERLEAITVGDSDDLHQLKTLLERTKTEHTTLFEKTTLELKTKMQCAETEATARYEAQKSSYEQKLAEMKSEHEFVLSAAKEQISGTKEQLTTEIQKYSEL